MFLALVAGTPSGGGVLVAALPPLLLPPPEHAASKAAIDANSTNALAKIQRLVRFIFLLPIRPGRFNPGRYIVATKLLSGALKHTNMSFS
jgi:hypothetical protein